MASLILIMIGFIGAVLFLHLRRQSEVANAIIQQYCREHDLQWVSTARAGQYWGPQKNGLLVYRFNFEFSSNGENCYQGTLLMSGLHSLSFIVPPYAID